MTILYVILSCPAYRETRQRWQLNTWLKGQDYIYLEEPDVPYLEVAKKYIPFFQNYNGTHDWLFFCDDDTFVFTDKLELLLLFAKWNSIIIGHKGGVFERYGHQVGWCSGGAGFAVSADVIASIQESAFYETTNESDTTLAIWASLSNPMLTVIGMNELFCPTHPRDSRAGEDCITYHYCIEKDFETLSARL